MKSVLIYFRTNTATTLLTSQLESRCLRRQIYIPWEKRKILERVSSSRWVRGLGLVKESQPARPRGRKEAIKRTTSGLNAGHQLTFIASWNNYMGQWQRQRAWEREREIEKEIKEIEMKEDGCSGGILHWGKAWPDHSWEKGQAIKTDDFLLESDYPLEAQREPYKSLLIKTGQFIDGLMSLGH